MDDRLLVMRMVAYIEQHLLEDLQGRELVRISGYSDNRLREKFYSITGDTPNGYIRKRRLTEAAKAIMAGGRIADVALGHGYSSQDNFTTAFKSWFGVTPGELHAMDSKYRTFFARIKEPLNIMEIVNLKQLPLNTTLMGCIKGASDYYELDSSVPSLFGLSSHAFLINLHGELCPSSPYVWNKTEFYRLLEGLGIRRVETLCLRAGAAEAEIRGAQARVKAHLGSGQLCMLDYLEHQLISGYDEKGFLFLKPWNGMSPSELSALSFGTWEECLTKEGWAQFTLLERSGVRCDFKEQLRDSLSVALAMFASPGRFQLPHYRIGFGAWETWISRVREGSGTTHGHWWNASVWSECRLSDAILASARKSGRRATEGGGMFRQLPTHPDIRHLKRQARTLLRDLRRGDPEAAERVKSAGLGRAGTLSDALHVVAREYGFESWPKLQQQLGGRGAEASDPVSLARKAFREDDARAMQRLLAGNAVLRSAINEPEADFDAPAVTQVRSRAMLDVLLDFGADINAKSRWWAGGFGLLDCADPALAEYVIGRGAIVGPHAAARLGMIDRLAALVADDADVVHARGGDGQTPLHFASSIEVARLLLDHGADIDARDVDHESTPAQYMVKSRPRVACYLVSRGCATDILMAAALGDLTLARTHIASDPDCIRMRVSDEYFAMVGKGKGGTIYQWELGWYVSACQVAHAFGHADVLAYLTSRCPPEERLLDACWMGRTRAVASLRGANGDIPGALSPATRRHVAHAARNNDLKAVRLMLSAGLPADARSQHEGTALHWAAFHGNARMVRLLLAHHPPLEDAANDYNSTPLGWAIEGSENGWYAKTGDYAAAVEALLSAGARHPRKLQGSDAVRRVLMRHRSTD